MHTFAVCKERSGIETPGKKTKQTPPKKPERNPRRQTGSVAQNETDVTGCQKTALIRLPPPPPSPALLAEPLGCLLHVNGILCVNTVMGKRHLFEDRQMNWPPGFRLICSF